MNLTSYQFPVVCVEDEANDVLVWVRHAFSDLIVKLVQVINNLHHPLHLMLILLALLGDCHILAIDELAQPGGHLHPHCNGVSEVANGGHHGICRVLVTRVANGDSTPIARARCQSENSDIMPMSPDETCIRA